MSTALSEAQQEYVRGVFTHESRGLLEDFEEALRSGDLDNLTEPYRLCSDIFPAAIEQAKSSA